MLVGINRPDRANPHLRHSSETKVLSAPASGRTRWIAPNHHRQASGVWSPRDRYRPGTPQAAQVRGAARCVPPITARWTTCRQSPWLRHGSLLCLASARTERRSLHTPSALTHLGWRRDRSTEARTPLAADADDHQVAAWAATEAGHLLLEVRQQGLEGRALKDAGDQAAHELLMRLLAEQRPDDVVLTEEGKDDRRGRPERDRVWIVDPLDGTREFSEPPRDDWAVHVALWERPRRRAGGRGRGAARARRRPSPPASLPSYRPRAASVRASSPRAPGRPRFVKALVEELDAELVPMGSAGAKVMSVVRDVSDAYVHAGGQYEWDSAAPVAVARAAGLFTSRVDGSPLVYNQDDVLLPDLIVCRPELAAADPRLRPRARHRLRWRDVGGEGGPVGRRRRAPAGAGELVRPAGWGGRDRGVAGAARPAAAADGGRDQRGAVG